MRRAGLALGLLIVVGCASAPRWPDAAELAARARARAEAQVLEGCYDCLLEARATLGQLAVGRARQALLLPMFEVELLIALREKELALDSTASLVRARTLAAELPDSVDTARYLAIVDAVPPDALGLPEAEELAFRRSRNAVVPRINGELDWLREGPLRPAVRTYLSLSLDCKYLNRNRAGGQPLREERPREVDAGAPPLIRYRFATCDRIDAPALEALQAEAPGFVEAALFRARLAVSKAQDTGGADARPLLSTAYGRFPQSPAVTYLNANFQQLIGDCRNALRYYDETLALKPLHENALLGRTVCLTFLSRFDEAIESATHMIELRTSNMHEAYYWRAWVQHHLQNLPAAREDIDRAKAIASSNDIHRLAGIIEHDQDDLDAARKDLFDARNSLQGGSDCVTRWYLGLVFRKKRDWLDAAKSFEDAMNCYERAALLSQRALGDMEARADIDPEFKARQIEGFRIAIDEDRSQQYAAAFNAANHFAGSGDKDKARTLLDVAARDPKLADMVAELRRFIGG
jgi:tetratricopeptide (TPR) repeat protein